MKNWRIVIVFLLCLALASSIACNPLAGEEEVTEEEVEVVRGDLTVTVSGSGNIEVSNEVKLTFGVGGKVDKIYVQEGDEVREGELLATLETDALKLALTQAQVAKAKAQLDVTQAQVSVTQAEVARQTAKLELDKAKNIYKWPALEIQQANVDRAMLSLQYAYDRLAAAPADQKEHWALLVARAEANLIIEEEILNVGKTDAGTKAYWLSRLNPY